MGVVLKPGWLYFLRDRDYRSGAEGDYVKIGLMNFERPVADRIDDHQTGNPRVRTLSTQVSAISTVENYLHHQYAVSRVHGDGSRCLTLDRRGNREGRATERTHRETQEKIEARMEIYNMPSNGVVRGQRL